jgi:putative FmdB family regulatory protein
MPTYEYRCPKGHLFELFQKMSDEPRATCPECGAESERILSGGAGFLFKGEGFYITDYRSDSYKKAASQEKGSNAVEGPKEGKGKSPDPGAPAKKAKKPGKTSASGGETPSTGS